MIAAGKARTTEPAWAQMMSITRFKRSAICGWSRRFWRSSISPLRRQYTLVGLVSHCESEFFVGLDHRLIGGRVLGHDSPETCLLCRRECLAFDLDGESLPAIVWMNSCKARHEGAL